MHLAPDTLLQNRYRVVRLVAHGGMGAVYQAEDQRLGNIVALKQTLVQEPQLRAAFGHEAQLLARLHHPALPMVSDHFTENNSQFLVMQFIDGDDLGTLIDERGQPFLLADVIRWADRLLDVLDYLHSQQPPIIHRDIKPQNLKRTAHGDIVLLDFGLAKRSLAHTTPPGRSIYGYTPHYAPLEQIHGIGTDARSDLYALAATLYHLLTAQVPPDALTRAGAVISSQPDPLQPAHAHNPHVPRPVSDLLMQAMAQNPMLRPASAAVFRKELRRAAADTLPETVPFPPRVSSSGQPTIVMRAEDTHPQVPPLPRPPAVETEAVSMSAPATKNYRSPFVYVGVVALLLFIGSFGWLVWGFMSNVNAPAPSEGTVTTRATAPSDVAASTVENGSVAEAIVLAGTSRSAPLPRAGVASFADWQIEVLETKRGQEAWADVYEANQFNDPAPDGMEYLLARMRVASTRPVREEEARKLYLKVTGDRLVEYVQTGVAPEPRLELAPSGGVASEGWIPFLIAENERNLLLKVDELLANDVQPVYVALDESAAIAVDPTLRTLEATRVGTQRSEPANIGELVRGEDWEAAVLETVRGDAAWEMVYAENQFNDPPEQGMEYVVVRLQLRSISPKDEIQLINSTDFQTVDSDGEAYRAPAVIDPAPALNAYLYPGGRYEGWVTVEVPIGDDGVVLMFNPSLSSNELNTRYLTLEE